ncbi:hypothetical protein TI39_contig586g00001 [Zymoseptoria brevis]|uniref:Uncharacterized protein n=1 Tax=Zymoseptoria brevis TaxID=1047168 RepID=A0A0F4GJ00_9PEZI|nr:hypothetical protein TI39_contig586g00001 [Zymoseptoria brevis]
MTQGDGSHRDQDTLRRLPVPMGPWWVANPTVRTTILNEAGGRPPCGHPYATTLDLDEVLLSALPPRPSGMPSREPDKYPSVQQPVQSNGQIPFRRQLEPRPNWPGDQEPQYRGPRDGRPRQQVDSQGRPILSRRPDGESPYQMYDQQARPSNDQQYRQGPPSDDTGEQQEQNRRLYSGPPPARIDTPGRRVSGRSPGRNRAPPVRRESATPVISYALPYRAARPPSDTSHEPRPSSRRANAGLYQSQTITSARRPQPRDASGSPYSGRRGRTASARSHSNGGPPAVAAHRQRSRHRAERARSGAGPDEEDSSDGDW